MNWLTSKSEKKNDSDEIEAYYPTAMSGFSDSYSSLTNDEPMSHSFDFLNNSFKINAPNENEKDVRKNNNVTSDLEINYEKLKQSRDLEVSQELRRV